MIDLVVGSVPRGPDYFGQEALIETLWSRLERDNVLLVAPRRFGKTGAMYRLLDQPRQGFRPIYINVEHITTAADFMVETLAALLRDHHFARVVKRLWEGTRGLGEWLRNLPATLDVGGIKVELREKTDVPAKWLDYGSRVMGLLASEGTPALLLIDELPIMVNHVARRSKEEVEQFLRWFRSARTAPGTRTRFVIGGSINLVSSLNALGLVDTINDLSVVRLRPWSQETAGRFVEAIFESRKIELLPQVKEKILELVGIPIPYFLQVLLTAISERSRTQGGTVSTELVGAAFEEDLLGGMTSAVFQHYRARLDQYYLGSEGHAAKAILATLSRADSPVQRDTLYQIWLRVGNVQPTPQSREDFLQLMQKLDNDFYVVEENEGYTFFSRVLKLWWKRYYGFQEG